MLEKIIYQQVDILASLDLLEGELAEAIRPFSDRVVVENKNILDIYKTVFDTIESLTDKEFREWIEWFVYETEFGAKDLKFSVDDKEFEPTLENIIENVLKECL